MTNHARAAVFYRALAEEATKHPMVAMTPERIAVLQAISTGMYEKFGVRPRNAIVLDEMIAEARREDAVT